MSEPLFILIVLIAVKKKQSIQSASKVTLYIRDTYLFVLLS